MRLIMIKKLIPVLGILAALLVIAVAYVGLNRLRQEEQTRTQVTASFYPLAHFAQQVGGDLIDVVNLTPAGAEPHDFEPTPQDITTLRSSQLFLANGAGLDPWAERLQSDLESNGVKVVMMTNALGLGDGEAVDPHIWLDPILAKQQVAIIADALSELDPANGDIYHSRANSYTSQLDSLHESYQQKLANCERRDIVTSHDAFRYLADRYQLTVHAVSGLSPEEEPSARQLAEVADIARSKNVRYIFFETLVSPKLAETVAKEVGAETLVFNPIEGLTDEEIEKGSAYITIMEENLNNLVKALACQ